ncbi:MAG TPA: M20/M25/M40 family metallo-hydrolase [Bacteroidales bacterium]|nr:M20/M25/M40 family metallo-hydrolase [Bacteroidales bacterium]
MKIITKTILISLMILLLPSALKAQLETISADELKGHIHFLASDFMNGRVGPSEEYEIAAQYVASQFAAAGLKPAIEINDSTKSFFQGVPFVKTKYNDKLNWNIKIDGELLSFEHREDFKIMYGSKLNHDHTGIAWAGYGIEETDHGWNDFENMDVAGKVIVCISGAPVKNGTPVLPEDVHNKYTGPNGFRAKFGNLFSKGAEALVMVDINGSSGVPFEMMPSEFRTEKYVYKDMRNRRRSSRIPSIYFVKPSFLQAIMKGNPNSPFLYSDNLLKNYKPQILEGVYLDSKVEILNEDIIYTNNVVGLVEGTDPELKNEYITVGAHLDHVKKLNGQVCNGADDNASGSAGVIEIAEALALKPCKRSVVFITYTAEEMGLCGSRYFVGSGEYPIENIRFNLNMDMIGRSDNKNKESRAHYVVTNKKYLAELETFINELNNGITDFPLIFDDDEHSPGGSDHQSFISQEIPAFFFFSGVHEDLHKPGDDPEKIDYAKAEDICKLGYTITEKLANMDEVPNFLKED